MPRCSLLGGWEANSCQFWLKPLPPFCLAAASGEESCMSAPLVETEEISNPEGDFLLKALLLAVLTVGIALGWLVTRCLQVVRKCCPERAVSAPSWKAIVVRALRFIRKRRRIAVAFSNYRNYPLNHSPSTPPRKPPRRRRAGDLLPLEEGPVIRDGSHR